MGNTYAFMQAEQKTWIEHTIVYDPPVRLVNLRRLDSFEDGSNIYLSFNERSWGGISFQHWFVTDRLHFFEFGSANIDIYTARVNINAYPRDKYPLDPQNSKNCKKMDKQVRDRMRHVLGMSNYSLCLRNCEHVANYVFRGRWFSSQMDKDDKDSILMDRFRNYMLGDKLRMVNSFPASIRQHVYEGKNKNMYTFIDDHYNFTRFDYYLDYEEDTYNVLIVGPTGAGKSHLVNVLFNEQICDSEVSHRSVTREIYFIRGRGQVYNIPKKTYEERNIVVADTIGLCDTEWDDDKVISLIKNRISSNINYIDAVFIIFKADRLIAQYVENIQQILKWLGYYKKKSHLRFLFIGTHADHLSNGNKNSLRKEATEIFGLERTDRVLISTGEEFESLVYTGFPSEDDLNDKAKEKVKESWNSVLRMIKHPGNTDRLYVGQQSSCTIL